MLIYDVDPGHVDVDPLLIQLRDVWDPGDLEPKIPAPVAVP